jgi:hypothetical protein
MSPRQPEGPALRDFDERNITDAVIDRFKNTPDPRRHAVIRGGPSWAIRKWTKISCAPHTSRR